MTANELAQFKTTLEAHLEQNKLKKVARKLKELSYKDVEHRHVVINLSRTVNKINEDLNHGMATRDSLSAELGKVTYAFLHFIEDLELEDLETGALPEVESVDIQNPILVLCFKQADVTAMETFFSPLDFAELEVKLALSYDPAWNQKYDITIWNNLDLAACPKKDTDTIDHLEANERELLYERLPVLEQCLESNPSPHFIHLGEPLFLVTENRNRIYAANSFYSLYARLKEMVDYINTYRA